MNKKFSPLDDDETQIILNSTDMTSYSRETGKPFPKPGQTIEPQEALRLIETYYRQSRLRSLIGFTAFNDESTLIICGVNPDKKQISLSDNREHPPKVHDFEISNSQQPHTTPSQGDMTFRLVERFE